MNARWFEPHWPAPSRVRTLCTFRGGAEGASKAPYARFNLGDHVGDDPVAVAENRRVLRHDAALPSEPRWLAQVHGISVADLDRPGREGPADAAVSRLTGTVCAILTADCLPILLTTSAGDRVAAAHAGWRGLAAGVIEATVHALDCPAADLLAWLGPAIGPRHFEVGAEVREAFMLSDPAAAAAFQSNGRERFLADLPALARQRLANLGVSRIFGGGECTFEKADRYYSHRRDGITGRQATLIWRER